MNRIVNVYSVRDSKSEIYHAPQYFNTDEAAKRWIADMLQYSPEAPVTKFPEDYDLYHLGTFDQTTGQINAFETPSHVVKAIHCKRSQPAVQ